MFDISSETVKANRDAYTMIDVRELSELRGDMGLIEGAHHVPMGEALLKFFKNPDPSKSYVFICAAGVRSAIACEIAISYGLNKVYNLEGGMRAWNADQIIT